MNPVSSSLENLDRSRVNELGGSLAIRCESSASGRDHENRLSDSNIGALFEFRFRNFNTINPTQARSYIS